MTKNILFSIIIPVRKINPYLRETLSHLKAQSLKNFEILVIDDKVSGTANPSQKRNLGAKKARGTYLVFFDDDSFPSLNYFKNAAKLVKKHPDYAAFCGPCLTPKKDNLFQQASGLVWSSYLGSGGAGTYRNRISSARFVDDYPSVNLIIKKTDFNRAGKFDPNYWPGEDTVLCLNLTKKLQQKIYYHPSLVVYHHRRQILIPHLQQITRYAVQRGYFVKKFPQTSFRLGYFLPSLFLIYCLTLIVNLFTLNLKICYLPLYLYLSILFATFVKFIIDKNRPTTAFLAATAIPLTHFYYGILFLYGLSKKESKFKPHAVDKKTGKYLGG
ncbi:MAG TPA: glycosyltransferase [Candidatus Woesebacteria bacterium]|nr:glycosyltransferase [Candidatus Woesebacteria bacterium]